GRCASAGGPPAGAAAPPSAWGRWGSGGGVRRGAGTLLSARPLAAARAAVRPRLDLLGSLLSALGLGLAVVGVLRSSEWGWLLPASGGPSWLGMSPVFWLTLGGVVARWLFLRHIRSVEESGGEPLVSPSLFSNRQLRGGLTMFFFQFVVMMGIFFVIPLYLSVALGLSAIETGIKITPLSLTMLLGAAGVPRFFPSASPRRVVELSLLAVIVGLLVLISTMDVDASAQIVTVPLLLIGLGMGGLASQLGSVTVSAVPNDKSPEVGG